MSSKAQNEFKKQYFTELSNSLMKSVKNSWPDFDPPLRIGIMASGEGTNLEQLYNLIINQELNVKISMLVVNNPDCNAIKRAERLGINYTVIDHKNFKTRESLDLEIIKIFSNLDVELIVMAGWMRIVTLELINFYKNRIINIHPSLLPSFKGNDAIIQSLNYRVSITGCTIHYVEQEVDSGEIILQAPVPVYKTDTESTLMQRIHKKEHLLLPYAIAKVGESLRCDNH